MKTQVESHLAGCKECTDIYVLQILSDRVIGEEKSLLPDPFLSTRILAGIEKSESPRYETFPVITRVLRPALLTLSLAAAVFLGVIIGNIYKPAGMVKIIPVEMALIDDASLESIDILLTE
jgi:hypothetical protein